MSQCRAPQSSIWLVTGWFLGVCAAFPQDVKGAEYQATSPNPGHGMRTVDPSNVRLAWTPAQQAGQQRIYLGTDQILTGNDLIAPLSGNTPSYFYSRGFELGQTYFWRIDTVTPSGVLHVGETWTFTTLSYQAGDPSPAPGTNWVSPENATLTWQSGLQAVSHDVYFGMHKQAVELGLASAYVGLVVGTEQVQYALPPLEKGATYYWRIDERQSSGLITQGDLWSFSTLASAGGIQGRYFNNTYLGEAPVLIRVDDAVDLNYLQDNALRRVLSSNRFSVRWTGRLVSPSSSGATLTVRANDRVRLMIDDELVISDWLAHPLRELSTPWVQPKGTTSQIVLEYAHTHGTPHVQLLWSYDLETQQIIPHGPLQPHPQSHLPSPADSATETHQSPRLSWQPGTRAVTHNLYLGTHPLTVAQAQPGDAQFLSHPYGTSHEITDLLLNQTYYWRVDDVNAASQPNVSTGPVWQFTTADHILIDDFESYTNIPSERLFETWVDGFGFSHPSPGHPGNNSGATVGHIDPPYAEQTLVHDGRQSMPLMYNNSGPDLHSEATHAFEPPLDMSSRQGTQFNELHLSFQGRAASMGHFTGHQNSFTLTGAGTGFWDKNDRCYFVYQSVSGSASISARIDSIEQIHALSQAGLMIRSSQDPNALQACVAITADGRLAAHYRGGSGQPVTSLYSEPGAVALPHWIKLQRQGATLSMFHSQDGLTWNPVNLEGQPAMSLSGFASLGLMHCVYRDNHTAGLASFSQVTSSSVTPLNMASSLGIPLNQADDLYLLLEDTQGGTAIIRHPANPNAVLQNHWETWRIDLAGVSGVQLDAIKTLSIGVGSPNQAESGGTGVIFIDDIIVHP